MKETSLMFAIRAALTSTGRVTLWRNNCGVDLDRKVRYGLGVGSADLIGILKPDGRFIAFEVKTETGRLSSDQKLWIAAVRNAGALAFVVRSVEEALACLP